MIIPFFSIATFIYITVTNSCSHRETKLPYLWLWCSKGVFILQKQTELGPIIREILMVLHRHIVSLRTERSPRPMDKGTLLLTLFSMNPFCWCLVTWLRDTSRWPRTIRNLQTSSFVVRFVVRKFKDCLCYFIYCWEMDHKMVYL